MANQSGLTDTKTGPDTKTGGGALSLRIQRGERLRAPERSADEHRERITRGEAWRDFCRTLERTGDFLLEAQGPAVDDRTLAEGVKYLLGMATLGLRGATEIADPEYPAFARIEDLHVKWGAENADNHYLHAQVRGDRNYRIRGERGSCMTFLVEVKEGFMHMGDVRNFATVTADQLEVDPDGSFEILVSGERPPGHGGNWLALDPDATQIVIRQYLCDWEREELARFTIECLETTGQPPAPPTPARMGRAIDAAAHFVDTTTRFWAEWVPQMREEHVRGELKPAVKFTGGADDIRYGNDMFELEPGEAIVIESDVPTARYWHYQLCNVWFVTMDYANRLNSINHAQAHIDADGRVRVVIAHEDPGCPNWLDTGGEREGMIQYRYIWTQDAPRPDLKIVPAYTVFEHLPSDTPRVGPEERRNQVAARQRAVARRFRL